MELRLKGFLATNPYPVFLADKDGRVLYSNETGEPLLQELGTGIGEKLPLFIGDFVRRAISSNKTQRTEIKVEKSIYLFLFQPSKVENSVNIYGFDVTDQRKFEDTFKIAQENLIKAQKNVENIIEERAIQLAGSYNLLKESEKELIEAYKIAHIGTWEWEIATDLTYWSDEMFRIFRRDPQELAPSY